MVTLSLTLQSPSIIAWSQAKTTRSPLDLFLTVWTLLPLIAAHTLIAVTAVLQSGQRWSAISVLSRLAAIFGGDGDGHGVLRLGLRLGCRRKRRDGRRGGMRRDGLAGRGDMGLSAIKVLQLELE